MEAAADPNATINMEMELLEVSEYIDLSGDGCQLMRVIQDGKKRGAGVPIVTELSTVTVHYRIGKLLLNYSLKDTRMGLANSSEGLVMREDRNKEPIEFIVGEEEAAGEGDFVPPIIGQCLLLPPGGVVEGMQFELILRDGVPVSNLEKSVYTAYLDGMFDSMPDTTGPVVIRLEVEKVVPPVGGLLSQGWRGTESVRQERQRAEELENLDGGRHRRKALKRWRRIISWLEQLLQSRRCIAQASGSATKNMYDFEWEDDSGEAVADSTDKHGSTRLEDATPSLFEADDALVRQLQADELLEWATAHAAAAEILAGKEGDLSLCRKHAQCVVQASLLGQVPKHVEIRGRSQLAARLLESGDSSKALQILKVAQELDPTSNLLRDQFAIATQKDNDRISGDMKETLRRAKKAINDGLEADDVASLLARLEEIERLPLAWDAVHETAIGKEVGKCAKHPDPAVQDRAKAIIAALHRLAKHQRPMWVGR